jgi:hypothetical protein
MADQTALPPVPREPIVDNQGRMSSRWTRWLELLQRSVPPPGQSTIYVKAETGETLQAVLTDNGDGTYQISWKVVA